MCGIFGAIGDHNVRDEVLQGTASLLHRGQEAAGILCVNEKKAYHLRVTGDISRIIDQTDALARIHGNMGVGHLRYSTSGSKNDVNNAQPLYSKARHVGFVHNGQVQNMAELEEIVRANKVPIRGDSDGELLLGLFMASLRGKTPDAIFRAVEAVQKTAVGGYSCILPIKGVGLLAFTDPWGFWPLVMAERETAEGKSVVFSSEDVAFVIGKYSGRHELRNGEAVLITQDLKIQQRTLMQSTRCNCIFNNVYFGDPDSEIFGAYNAQVRYDLARVIARRIKITSIDDAIVVPVPNAPIHGAEGFADETDVLMRMSIHKAAGSGRIFIHPGQQAREEKAKLAFRHNRFGYSNKDVYFVDDSLIRGTNLKEIVYRARELGARSVHAMILWPAVKYGCPTGMDMHEHELAARDRTHEALTSYLGLDSLTFGTQEENRAAAKNPTGCMACTDGNFPTELHPLQRKLPVLQV